MPTDAFGREIEDGPGARAVGPAPRRRRDPARGLPIGVLVLVLAVLSLGGSALVLVAEERANVDDPVQAGARGEITGLDARSLLRRGNLDRAWAVARRSLRATDVVLDVRVTATALVLTVRDDDESRRDVMVDLADEVDIGDRGETDRPGLPPDAFPLDAVERAARGVARRTPPDAVVTDVRSRLGGGDAGTGPSRVEEWSVSVRGARIADRTWFASGDGTRIRRADEPSTLTAPQEPS